MVDIQNGIYVKEWYKIILRASLNNLTTKHSRDWISSPHSI
jgi:hypothetical protein